VRPARILAPLSFLTVVLSVAVGGHLYVANRLVLDAAWHEPWRTAGLALVWAGFASLLLQPVGERLLPQPWSRAIAWPASLWMGFAFLLLVTTAASDAALWAAGSPALADAGGEGNGAARARALAVIGLAALAGAVGLRTALRPPAVKRVEIALARWPRALDGFRIVQISDLHVGPILGRAFAEQVVARVNELSPDLIAVTGDLVDGSAELLREQVAPFADLRAPAGAFFVTGNHDCYSGAEAWVERARELGLRVLRNERVEVERGGARFDLAGVEDHHAHWLPGGLAEDLDAALEGRDRERPVVLLAHDPATFRGACERGVDLQLSGHTHGGQIWPFVWAVRLAVRWVAGLYVRSGSTLYVSRGTGFWGPPMRLFAPAEITEIVLRSPGGSGD
jgi:predicted MPP superfamily phosphohydrolase